GAPSRLEPLEPDGPDVHGGGFEGLDESLDGVAVDGRNDGAEPLRGDAVDRSRGCLVEDLVTADTGVKPVGDVECAVRAHGDVGGAEQGADLVRDTLGAPEEIRSGEGPAGVAGEEIVSLQAEAGPFGLGLVGKDDIATGLAGKEGADPLLPKGAIFIKDVARG